MTAEIALLNKEAVALAADSAVTLSLPNGQQKILPSANKIFALSKYNPVGVMVYGNAQLMEVPWEVIIKHYRSRLGTKSFDSLQEYAAHFVEFLANATTLFSSVVQERFILTEAELLFRQILEEVKNARLLLSNVVQEEEDHGEPVDEKGKHQDLLKAFVGRVHESWRSMPVIATLPDGFGDRLRQQYSDGLRKLMVKVFVGEKLSPALKRKLLDLSIWAIERFKISDRERASGLVVAGFGREDVFPSLRSYHVHSVLNQALVYSDDRNVDVATTGAAILPFAQHEMVSAFMEGIDKRYHAKVHELIGEVMTGICNYAIEASGLEADAAAKFANLLHSGRTELVKEVSSRLAELQRDQFSLPVVRVTALLPKSELASMAEALVNLTTFKRKVSMEAETVGGPIDVAVISKGDGFIWVKRKHYFTKELNPQFFANYYREGAHEHT